MTMLDLMSDEEFAAFEASHGPGAACYERFGRWLEAWTAAHPDDWRTACELAVVYGDWPDDAEIGEARDR